jgi:predicted PurR-regulated permease PerM
MPDTSEVQTGPQPALAPPASLPRRNWTQIIIAAGVVLTLCYVGELVLVVVLTSVLLAVTYGVTYFSYNEAVSFLQDLPKYSSKIRATVMRYRQQAESFRKSTEFLPPPPGEARNIVTIRPASSWVDLLTRGFGSVSQTVLALSFIPFLVYFMLSWQQHVRSATVMLFRMEHRNTAYVTLGLIAKMMRSFMVGNLVVGLFMSAVSTAVFAAVHLPFFYFVGTISGFLSLIPYLGVLLALAPPLMVGIGQIQSGDVFLIIFTVLGLHVFSLNILYPKFLGRRLQLNPLAVTISLLFWGWLWGGIGLLLAVPITGAMKIIFDHIQSLRPYGAWLGE